MKTLTAEQLSYGQQKNREHMYRQAQDERREMKARHNDTSFWNESDEAWTDYRYMQICDENS